MGMGIVIAHGHILEEDARCRSDPVDASVAKSRIRTMDAGRGICNALRFNADQALGKGLKHSTGACPADAACVMKSDVAAAATRSPAAAKVHPRRPEGTANNGPETNLPNDE